MMQVKGSAIFIITHFIKNSFGQEGLDKWLDALSPEAKKIYSGNIIPPNYYPLQQTLTEPTMKVCEVFFNGDYSKAYEIGRFSADYSLTGVYKFFIKLGSPSYVINKGNNILMEYYKPCKIEVIENEKNHAVMRVTEFSELHEVIEQRIAGWMARAIELTGMKDVSIVVTKSLTKGDPYTEFTGNWK